MGAKDWMLFYADSDVRSVLESRPAIDRAATRALVERLHPGRPITELRDGTLMDANPPTGEVYAACFPGLTVVCTEAVALDEPSQLAKAFIDEAQGRTLYLHAMHSVVDWFAYAIWDGDGKLQRSLSLTPDSGIAENIGTPLPFEASYWAGDRPLDQDEDEDPYPLPFHPLEMAEDALRALFGFVYEGTIEDDDTVEDVDPETVPLAVFRIG
jgi:hypothetical protein